MGSLIIIRHGIAEDTTDEKPDALRRLTAKGERRMRAAAAGLRHLQPALGAILASPLTRATQTGRILAEAFPSASLRVFDALRPAAPPELLLKALNDQPLTDLPMALVGHEPELSAWVAWAITGRTQPLLKLKKGGACRLDYDTLSAGTARLAWLLTPAQLRKLAA